MKTILFSGKETPRRVCEAPVTLGIYCPSTGGHEKAAISWRENLYGNRSIVIDDAIEGRAAGYLNKLEEGWHWAQRVGWDVIAYFHNDIYIHTPAWDVQVLQAFEDPKVAVAGFFGAKQHGRGDLYLSDYDYRQLVRADCVSNLVDAECHGRRLLEPTDIAVIDSLACIVRRSFLDDIGGWLVSGLEQSHASDYWICLMAHRHRKKVRYVPISCTHHSGGVRGDGRFDYAAWQAWYGKTDAQMHQENHRKLYDEFRDVLPVRIP